MKSKKRTEQQIRGWLPKEPNIPVFLSKPKQKILTKTMVLWLSVGIIVAMLLGGAIFFTFFNLPNWWQGIDSSVADSENTMKAFVGALSSYDVNASWSLMSPALQASYGSMQNFTDTVVGGLRQSGWHAQVVSIVSVRGDFTTPTSLIKSSAHIKAELQVTQNGATTNGTYTFDLVKPSGWKIDNRFVIT